MPPPGASSLGGVAQLVFMLWAGAREGLWLRFAWPRWTPEIKEFFKAFGVVTFGAASVVVAPLSISSSPAYLPVGSRTALYYADRINQLPLGVLGIALGTVLLPEMSARLAQGRPRRIAMRRRTVRAAHEPAAHVAFRWSLSWPFPAPSCARSSPMAPSTACAATLAALALAAYGAGLPAMALVRIVASTFYARHDTLTPARATVTAIVCQYRAES